MYEKLKKRENINIEFNTIIGGYIYGKQWGFSILWLWIRYGLWLWSRTYLSVKNESYLQDAV